MDPSICLLPGGYGRVIGVLVGLFLFSCLYAIALEVAERRWAFVSDYTWLTVIAGVAFTLIAMALISPWAAALALAAFAVSGLPILVRSIALDVRRRQELRRAFMRRGEE